jgi:hypothetical protein
MYDGSVLAISKARKTELAGSQTPIIDFTLRAKVSIVLLSSRFDVPN